MASGQPPLIPAFPDGEGQASDGSVGLSHARGAAARTIATFGEGDTAGGEGCESCQDDDHVTVLSIFVATGGVAGWLVADQAIAGPTAPAMKTALARKVKATATKALRSEVAW